VDDRMRCANPAQVGPSSRPFAGHWLICWIAQYLG